MKSLVASLFVIGLVGFAVADDKKPEAAKIEKFESKKEDRKVCCVRACYVNFNKELGVPFEYLNTIGSRIATARKTPDPIDLAMAAQSLAVAETVSGKKASVTSAEVFAEALDLAIQRNVAAELAAMAIIAPDQSAKESLSKAAVKAKALEAEAAKASSESTKEILDSLTVQNLSGECIKIYVDGFYIGTVHENRVTTFSIHTRSHNTLVQAICEEDGHLVGQTYSHGHKHDVFWTVR